MEEETKKGNIDWIFIDKKVKPDRNSSLPPVIYCPFSALLVPPFVTEPALVLVCVMENGEYLYKISSVDKTNPFKELIFNAVGEAPNALTELFDTIRAQHPDKRLWKK